MVERRRIVELWRSGRDGVLVTLVRAEGSSYRRPGARMLIGTDEHAGTISGGCLESEVVRKAGWLTRHGAVVERYSTLFDDTADMPFGLGCGGAIDLLLEPSSTPEARALLGAMAASLDGQESRVVSFLPAQGKALRRVVFSAAGEVLFASQGLSAERIECARELLPEREQAERFAERLRAPQRLLVLGAGDDARPLVSMAALLGWRVVVGDGRAQPARAERFPDASAVRLVQNAAELGVRPDDAVVLMTHSYEQDRALLRGLLALPEPPRYLGLLGSRHRSSVLVSEVAAMLGRSVEDCCAGLFAPVGLDLGGDGPEAIALAVVAEIQACCEGRLSAGSSRRLTAEEIVRQLAEGGASRYLQVHCGLEVA
jgi:xanthine/CO dehydrogenase XdhC/CoxF family maturation factor